jgi:hypothetical protein
VASGRIEFIYCEPYAKMTRKQQGSKESIMCDKENKGEMCEHTNHRGACLSCSQRQIEQERVRFEHDVVAGLGLHLVRM